MPASMNVPASNKPASMNPSPLRRQVSAEEWQTRVDLAACYRLIALHTFLMMFTFQRACEIQVMAQAGGGALIPIPQAILDGARAMAAGVTRSKSGLGGALAWPALLRKLDRLNPGYDA